MRQEIWMLVLKELGSKMKKVGEQKKKSFILLPVT